MKVFVLIAYLAILVPCGLQTYNVYSSRAERGLLVRINCDGFEKNERGIFVSVSNRIYELQQSCRSFGKDHFEGEQLQVLVNYGKGIAYLPYNRGVMVPFLMFLLFFPVIVLYLKKSK